MSSTSKSTGFWVLACGAALAVLVLALDAPGQKKPKGGKGGTPTDVVQMLQKARTAAKKAPHKYNGHRATAITHLDHAIKQLEAAGNSGKGKGKDKGKGNKGGQNGKSGKGGGGKSGNPIQLALQQMDQAIQELQAGMNYRASQQGSGGKTGKSTKGSKGKGNKLARDPLSQAVVLVSKAKQRAQKLGRLDVRH
jgi:hypothetical protein